jgi:hypothetical protein
MNLEQRVDQLERQTKRQRLALVVMAVALCGMVSMAATVDDVGRFDSIITKAVIVLNDDGVGVASMGSDPAGNGGIMTLSALGKMGVFVSSNTLTSSISMYQPNGKKLIELGSNDNGGGIFVYNKTGEDIVQVGADEYGNGVVGAYNRKGMGRTLKPGPQ